MIDMRFMGGVKWMFDLLSVLDFVIARCRCVM
jgi:hypothetical protein